MEKNTRDELIKVGAYIESKNGVEFSVRISKIEGSNVTGDGELSVPNWTIRR